ncbi:MAG TPA: FAD-dependent oxidoreductase [Fimbriimonadaceae bacterium]|nr:FAD-dependent oxidoreductase [Fimbriimonadaceae bacterium]HRJ95657.1 FAD-dependent oxidoreductase [Fimbriimonadaceae bacterium]
MTNLETDILIVGGGLGGCAAALAAAEMGQRVVMTEQWPEIGGQLVTQAVPPDEHPWIERFGCTRRYRLLRNLVREGFRHRHGLSGAARQDPLLNPGNGWVSRLCAEPNLWLQALNQMLKNPPGEGLLRIGKPWRPIRAEVSALGRIEEVWLENAQLLEPIRVQARIVLDATETGELLVLAQVPCRLGSDARAEFGEAHAPENANREDQQGFTWVQALGWDPEGDHTIEKPDRYDYWRKHSPSGWPGPQLSLVYPHVRTGEPTRLEVMGEGGLFAYRRVLDAAHFAKSEEVEPVTLVNWPQNDYFERVLLDRGDLGPAAQREGQSLTLSLLYWMQTELGLTGLRPRPDVTGESLGLAAAPYIREPRRMVGFETLTECEVGADMNPGRSKSAERADSVGIGAYRIDLHQSPVAPTLDISALPYQIPVSCLLSPSCPNLIAAGKCLSVSHIANGCTRLHPVEWNVGESAGVLAALSLASGREPRDFLLGPLLQDLQSVLADQGIELAWSDEVHPL